MRCRAPSKVVEEGQGTQNVLKVECIVWLVGLWLAQERAAGAFPHAQGNYGHIQIFSIYVNVLSNL